MKKRMIAILVLGLATATTASAMSAQQRAKYERSGCTQASELTGCDLNRSYEWNERHGFIDNDERPQQHGNRQHNNRESRYDDNHASSGINGKFTGNYEARFDNGQHSADIHIEDSGVYLNGNEVRDVNAYQDNLTFRVGYASYTINSSRHRGHWEDKDAGNAGTIVPSR